MTNEGGVFTNLNLNYSDLEETVALEVLFSYDGLFSAKYSTSNTEDISCA